MIEKIKITDNTDTPLHYLKDVPSFENGGVYEFTPYVNVLVGENGSGKSTLINLIKKYLMVEYEWCDRGAFNSNIRDVYKNFPMLGDGERVLHKGVDVYADYENNTFNLVPYENRHGGSGFIDFDHSVDLMRNLGLQMEFNTMSKGQKTTFALSTLFQKIFGKNAVLKFDYKSVFGRYESYMEYIEKHRIENNKTWTILMDEPDSSVDIDHIIELYNILSYKKENTQIICVIHNPFLIAKLAKVKEVNMIEMSMGYVKKIKKEVEKFNNI